ncbi:hypothetical protein L210DRAFT_3640898 [Boletus edulis BED1]|uniref:Uncharacterized protein n=1 Tax=Boletus edulis BED1 TaxID=1328754 RepID=A0AAD4C6V5_BOLED|nr:hypothetical protein L210DRAFT_3640898 [Boletus edulis BED1]
MSTALSAALIGTAIGLTVYRLWRNRGKQSGSTSPCQRGDWVPDVPDPPKHIETTTSPKTRKPCPTPSSVLGVITASLVQDYKPVTPPCSVSPAYTSPRSELDYVHVHHADDVEPDVEMDWIGDRLIRLIQESQKALGREIVVMSDAKEDEVDDGSDAWEEEQDSQRVPSVAAVRPFPVVTLSGHSAGHANPVTSPSHLPTPPTLLSHLPAARLRENAGFSLTRFTSRLDGRRLCRVHPAGVRVERLSNRTRSRPSSRVLKRMRVCDRVLSFVNRWSGLVHDIYGDGFDDPYVLLRCRLFSLLPFLKADAF